MNAAARGKSVRNGKIGRHVGNVGLQPPDELLIPDPQRLIGRHGGIWGFSLGTDGGAARGLGARRQ